MNDRGWRIKQSLYDRDMTARGLSQKLGITEATMSRYIHNNRTPNSDVLAKMAEVLGTTMEYLETGKDVVATEWIPVTERLPEEHEEEINVYDDNMNVKGVIKRMSSDYYLVTIKPKKYPPHIGMSFTVNGKFPDDVTAWQPLPEPYKED